MTEDPLTYLRRVISHAKSHLEMAEKALETQEWETLDFTLSVAANDIIAARAYLNSLAQSGMIRKLMIEKKE